MKLKKMVLVGNRRLMLNNIKTFTWTPVSPFQLVLGTNGSGKSSIIRRANPLPAVGSNYIKGGYEITEWEHNGSHYVLSSVFRTTSGKHSFVKDEEELNPGGTISVQRELVEQQFGINEQLMKVLNGELLFTDMSFPVRREWLTSLCDTDFTYALGEYNKARKAGRDAEGTVRHLGERLLQESNKLKALTDIDNLEANAEVLRNELNVLFTNRSTEQNSWQRLETQQQTVTQLLNRTDTVAAEIRKLDLVKPVGCNYTTVEDVALDIRDIETQGSVKEHLLAHYATNYSELEDLKHAFERTGTAGVEEIHAKLADLCQQIDIQRQFTGSFPIQPDAFQIQRSTIEALPLLVDVLTDLPDNSDYRFNRQAVQEAKQELQQLALDLDRRTNRIAQTEAALESIQNSVKTECPKCNHAWVPGLSPTRQTELQLKLKQETAERELLLKRKAELEIYLEHSTEYSTVFMRFKGLVNSYPRLRVLWDHLIEIEATSKQPREHIPVLYRWSNEVDRWVQLQELEASHSEFTQALEIASKMEGNTQLGDRLGKLAHDIEITTQEVEALKRLAGERKAYYRRLLRAFELQQELLALEVKLGQTAESVVGALRDTEIDSVVAKHHDRLAVLQQQISAKNSLTTIVNDLESSRNEVIKDAAAWKVLVEALSPSEGLIADQMQGFIVGFCTHMNSLINHIWTYDMQIKPCGLNSGELDYKFPVQINNEPNGPEDVKETSKGQLEIINFAFVMIVIFYLKLKHYPLYLDELGANFDEQHRINTMNFVRDLMDSGDFTQMIMISHYASSHGSFTQAETVVLDPSNVSVPKNHNQQVSLA